MAHFAKLFNVGDDQVLVTRSYDQDIDQDEIIFRADIFGLEASMKLGFNDEAVADAEFDSIDLNRAEKVYRDLKSSIEQLQGEGEE